MYLIKLIKILFLKVMSLAVWQWRSRKKISGGKYKKFRDKRKRELGRQPVLTRIGKRKIKKQRVIGGNFKIKLLSDLYVNVRIPKENKTVRVKVIDVLENPANRHFTRMDVITRGCILQTEIGKVRVTNRPGQDGIINGIFIEGG